MAGTPEFQRGDAPNPLVYTDARGALLDRLDMAVSASGWNWGNMVPQIVLFGTALAALQTVINVTGRGVAFVAVTSSDATQRFARCVITRNGVIISDVSNAVLANGNRGNWFGAGQVFRPDIIAAQWGIGPIEQASIFTGGQIGFTSSLQVQLAGDGTNQVFCTVGVIA